jgi:hypothetical protein
VTDRFSGESPPYFAGRAARDTPQPPSRRPAAARRGHGRGRAGRVSGRPGHGRSMPVRLGRGGDCEGFVRPSLGPSRLAVVWQSCGGPATVAAPGRRWAPARRLRRVPCCAASEIRRTFSRKTISHGGPGRGTAKVLRQFSLRNTVDFLPKYGTFPPEIRTIIDCDNPSRFKLKKIF